MPRIRNTKKLAQRIDRTYLQRVASIPLWRRILTAGCLAIALGWLAFYAVARNQTPYTAGPLTPAHAFLGKNCATCHATTARIGARVADRQCAACHDAPVHNAVQSRTPACIECHVEHRGTTGLAALRSDSCTDCHGNLSTKNGTMKVAGKIDSFANHPEFGAVHAAADAVGIRFNHQKHVGELSQKCSDCHPVADVSQGLAKPDPHSHVSSRALMAMPTYGGTCITCHPLTIDDKIADPAPHDKPAVVHQFVAAQLAKYIAGHPGDLGKGGAPGSASAWVQFRIAADEKALWETTCARCHNMGPADASGLPTVPAAKVPARWFKMASFDHAAHQALTCVSCHRAAPASKVATDVLLPGIQTCRQCHNSQKTSAGDSCSTCHVYHDWSKEKGVDGKYVIEQMTRARMPAGHPAL